MSRRGAIDQTVRKERASAIRCCRRCDEGGWQLGPDGTPIDPAVRCSHGAPAPALPPAVRDITEPIHQHHETEEQDR